MAKISNWGNYPIIEAEIKEFSSTLEIDEMLKTKTPFTVRGSGLSYGDASLAHHILSSKRYNKILQFDHENGQITVESGTTLDEILKVIVPKGWFLPVTPGTKFITVGGAVAGDVHGKNHHCEGSFCQYVSELKVMMADGQIKNCGSLVDPDLFKLICGGLGLSAVILTVQFRLKPISTSYIHQKNIIAENLDEMLEKLQDFNSATYSVSWIDCLARGKKLGRGVIMLGEHATEEEVAKRNLLKTHSQPLIKAPFYFPSYILNATTVRTFNFLFFNRHKIGSQDFIVHYDPYFYPLDFVKNWNKVYGRRGFLQYQFVIPFDHATKGLRTILEAISKSGMGSFLTVLKALGKGENTLSFPMPGFTLALDFPVSDHIFAFLDKLDKIVIDLGGRIYLVKDARMAPEIYWKGYPKASFFKEQVGKVDPTHKFASALSDRLQMI
jgi:decaprenylphospho-beta-D-ribofuranose 2-oxidase